LKIPFSVWLKFWFSPRVRCTAVFTHSPLGALTQSDELRITIPNPQYAQNPLRLRNR
jgi:hypothetical protein